MRTWQVVVLFVLALGSSALAIAQERNVNVTYVDADIRTIIQQVGQVTKTHVVIAEGVQGTLTFIPNGPMTANEFRRAILDYLVDTGYEITERNGVLLIGPIKKQ